MSTLAGAFNGLIAYGITKNLDGANGWQAWRWIFLIEGILPCVFAFVVLFLLPDSPESLRCGFNPEEKAMIVRRARSAHNASEAKLQMKKIPLVLMSLHFWLLLAIACCGHFCIGSMSNFLPAIIEVKWPYQSKTEPKWLTGLLQNRALDTMKLILKCLRSSYMLVEASVYCFGQGCPIDPMREVSHSHYLRAEALLGIRCLLPSRIITLVSPQRALLHSRFIQAPYYSWPGVL